MSLTKWFRGRRVQETKRRGKLILVKLARRSSQDSPQWIAVTPEEYRREVIHDFGQHPGGRRNLPP